MSEYMEQHSVARLLGAPPGYVGYDEGGQLTEAVRTRPYSVILFDEIEKAHPTIFNALLQLLDDGRLTDGKGQTVDFCNTVVIMTSNLGSHLLLEGVTADGSTLTEQAKARVMDLVRESFAPEFLNRLDDILMFSPLSRPDLHRIVQLQVLDIGARLKEQEITINVDEEAVDFILKESYQPSYGARPIKRFLERTIVTAVSRMILAGDVGKNQTITVGCNNHRKGPEELVYSVRDDNAMDTERL
jgi:ATP-dependent Clp protease ATP-binding subunit ClpB